MLQSFYAAFWQPISVYLFIIVAIPSMSMFPIRFPCKRWQRLGPILAAIALSILLRYCLVQALALLRGWAGFSASYFQNQMTYLISIFVFCVMLYRGNVLSMLLTTILALSLAGQIGFVYGDLMLLYWRPEFTPGMIILRDILGYGSYAVFFYLLRRFSNVTSFYISLRDHLVLIVISFINFFLGCHMGKLLGGGLPNLLFYVSMVFSTIAITFLLFRFTGEHEKALQQQTLLQDMKLSESALSQMQETSAQMKELRHELGNHFVYIETLVEQKQYDELKSYLRKIEQWAEETSQTVSTANPVVNAIINQKLSYARSLGIATQATVVLPMEALPLDDLTLCSLLGNLLNNAIDACRGQKDPLIHIDIHPLKSYLVVHIENSVTGDVLKNNPHLRSTKEDAANHGIGLRVTRRIVEEHNGMLHFEMCASDRFAVQVMLKV